LKAPHSKCGILARVSWVRIPPSPPKQNPIRSDSVQKLQLFQSIGTIFRFSTSASIWYNPRTKRGYKGGDTRPFTEGFLLAITVNRLSQLEVANAEVGMHADGGGLYPSRQSSRRLCEQPERPGREVAGFGDKVDRRNPFQSFDPPEAIRTASATTSAVIGTTLIFGN
jgi:hypothetical protein